MKRNLTRLFALLTAAVLILSLAACGKESGADVTGRYNCIAVAYDGENFTAPDGVRHERCRADAEHLRRREHDEQQCDATSHQRACAWIAKNTRSGVAGLSNVTAGRLMAVTPGWDSLALPSANAATASRKASRTEIASINGGSPTAFEP